MGVQTATPDFIASRLGNDPASVDCQQRSQYHDGAAQAYRFLVEIFRFKVREINVRSLKGKRPVCRMRHPDAHPLQQFNQFDDVQYLGDIGNRHLFPSQQARANHLQCLVFRALRLEFPLQPLASGDDKFTHNFPIDSFRQNYKKTNNVKITPSIYCHK